MKCYGEDMQLLEGVVVWCGEGAGVDTRRYEGQTLYTIMFLHAWVPYWYVTLSFRRYFDKRAQHFI